MLYRRWQPCDVLRYELDLRPRLAYPDHRIDAVRGTAAIERGPLVYCLGQAAQLRDRLVVGGIGGGIGGDVGQVEATREIELLEAVHHGPALDREAAAHCVDARVGHGQPRRDVE
jgi:hypothetical protein